MNRRTVLVALATAVAVLLVIVAVSGRVDAEIGRRVAEQTASWGSSNSEPKVLSMPQGGAAMQAAPTPPGGYPGGNTPAPVPTQTPIAPGAAVYGGMTGEEIADVLIEAMEAGAYPVAEPPTTFVASAPISPGEAHLFGLQPDDVLFQSPADIALVLSGDILVPGAVGAAGEIARYENVLFLLDTYSGTARKMYASNELQDLLDMLP